MVDSSGGFMLTVAPQAPQAVHRRLPGLWSPSERTNHRPDGGPKGPLGAGEGPFGELRWTRGMWRRIIATMYGITARCIGATHSRWKPFESNSVGVAVV